MKEVLSENGIEFKYLDITKDLKAMKQFLKIRDTNEVFNRIRRVGNIGIPVLVVEGKAFHKVNEEVIQFLKRN